MVRALFNVVNVAFSTWFLIWLLSHYTSEKEAYYDFNLIFTVFMVFHMLTWALVMPIYGWKAYYKDPDGILLERPTARDRNTAEQNANRANQVAALRQSPRSEQ